MNPAPEQKIPHILILEDDASHRELCIRAFRDDPDRFRVSVVATIRDARSVIEQDPPDLIFADWLLSEGRGIDILPRKDGRVAIPLIIMTSHGDEKIAVEVMKSGAVDYLVKSASLFKGLPHIARRSLDFWKNIQERKRAEEEAAESHKRLADILNFLPDATFAIDHEGRVIAWNRAIAEMTGVSAEVILGKGDYEYSIPFYGKRRPILIDLVDMDEAAILEKKYDYVKLEEGKITSEIYIPTLFGGRGAYLWGTASPLFDSAGTKVGAIEVIRDITKRKEDEDLLTRRQIALNALLNAPHDMIALVDREGTFLNINADGARRLGGTPEELIGQSSYAHLPPDLAESRRTYTDRVFMTGKPAIFDDERSGMYFHHEIFPVFNPEKTAVDYVAVFVREITSEKRAEDALKESERNLSRAQDVGHFGNWNWDITGNRLVWSDEMFRIFGVPLDFVPDYDAIVSMTHMDDREQYNRDIRDLLAGGNEGELEFRIVRPDGAERWVFQKIEVARDPQGSAIAAFGIVQDITDRKAAVQALFESEKKYRFLVDNILDSVWQTSPDLVFTYVSPAVTRQLGYSPEEVVGIPLTRLLTEPSARYLQGRLLERKEEFFQGNRDLSSLFEVEMVHRDGSIRSFEVSSTAVLGLDGSVEGFQGMTRDITERKRVKAALAESEERFRDLFSNMAAGVVIYTPTEDYTDFIIHDLNHAVETI
ncbi:MAG: PAS domain S-box protein, partial [Methanomicrobiales archaeon]|nr:PAS domain S-box protein [Methanomicrobiales archaeon]